VFCGWDWGSTVHGVCLIDDHGAVVKRWMIQHTEDQIRSVFGELAQLVDGGDVGQVPIAIERGEGLGRRVNRRSWPPRLDGRACRLQSSASAVGLSRCKVRPR
jgi:hypothetical protein